MPYTKDPVSGRATWQSGSAPKAPQPMPPPQSANPFAAPSQAMASAPNPFAAAPQQRPDVGWDAARVGVGVVGGVATAINPVIGGAVTGIATPIVNLLEGLFRR